MNDLSACMSVHRVYVRGLQTSEEGARAPGTGVTDGCDTTWVPELNPGPLYKQQVLITSGLSLQTPGFLRVIQSSTAAHGMGLPTFRLGLPQPVDI